MSGHAELRVPLTRAAEILDLDDFGRASMSIALAIALVSSTASNVQPVSVSKHIKKIIAAGDGRTAATAFRVSSVAEGYQIAAALNLKIQSQSLVIQKRPFDMFKTIDDAGDAREVWFDISSFYPEL